MELTAFAFSKRKDWPDVADSSLLAKRMKEAPYIKCHHCGKVGHKIADCRLRKSKDDHNPKPSGFTSGRDWSSATFFNCGRQGHIATYCRNAKLKSGNGDVYEKRVNVCSVLEHWNIGTIR